MEFSVGARLDGQVRAAICIAASRPDDWTPAIRQDRRVRYGAHVAEITSHVDVAAYPAGTRVLVRREPLHPGAQQTFDDIDGHRYTALLTTQTDTDLAAPDRRHRAHAGVEQRIRDAKSLGLRNLPSADFAINQIWLQLVLLAQTCSPGSPRWRSTATSPSPPPNRALPVAARRRTHHPRQPTPRAAPRRRLAMGRRPGRGVPKTPHPAHARVTTTHPRHTRQHPRRIRRAARERPIKSHRRPVVLHTTSTAEHHHDQPARTAQPSPPWRIRARADISGRFWDGAAGECGPSVDLDQPSPDCGGQPCAVGTINQTAIPAAESDGLITEGDKAARTFGEAQIDLDLLFDENSCSSFGSAMLKSRSSDSFTSQLKDFISPEPVDIQNCGNVIIRKQTEPDEDPNTTQFGYTKGLPDRSVVV